MFDLNLLIRPNIATLKPYSSARDEYKGKDGTFLDANENPYGNLNRYPDPQQAELKRLLAQKNGVTPKNIFIGNGSDELIDLVFRIFCEPGKDTALTFTPTYGMYTVSAAMNNIELKECPLNNSFDIDLEKALLMIEAFQPKLVFVCSPNNPTGNILDQEAIGTILKSTKGIVIVDEAYIDFSDSPSWTNFLSDYPNIIVSQTFSKARGLEAARVGIGYSSTEIISLLNKVKPPYNVSQLNQDAALMALKNETQFLTNLNAILTEKQKLMHAFDKIDCITKVFPSEGNFILIETKKTEYIFQSLIEKQIITRNRSSLIPNTIRISVGTAKENEELINTLKSL